VNDQSLMPGDNPRLGPTRFRGLAQPQRLTMRGGERRSASPLRLFVWPSVALEGINPSSF